MQTLSPFSCSYSPQIPELLLHLGCSIVISTYQAGKIVFISPKNQEHLVQLPRTFDKAMGVSIHGKRMAIATRNEVIVLANSPELARHYPKKPEVYDALFMPRATYYTGALDIHDLEWTNEGLIGVNTSFSCLAKINDQYSFSPWWTPSFITKSVSEDRCHLNGMAVANHKPVYATAFSTTDVFQGWRPTVTQTGVVIDIETNEVVCSGLPMPHSPRIYDDKLYLLLSATGELAQVDVNSGKYEVVKSLGGFVRGMAKHGDYLFIAHSKLRKNSSTFAKLDFAKSANWAGISILHLPTAALVGEIKYQASVDEIYDVQILSNSIRPNVMNTISDDHRMGLSTPDATYWAAPNQKKPNH